MASGFKRLTAGPRLLERDLSKPLTLPEIVEMPWPWGAAVPVLTVDISSVELCPQFEGRDVKVLVKYGRSRDCARCETCEVRASKPPRPAAADFVARAAVAYQQAPAIASIDTTCLFRGRKEKDPCIHFSLVNASRGGATIARAEVPLMAASTSEAAYDLDLFATTMWKKQRIGRMHVTVEWCSVPKAALSLALQVMGATRQSDAFTASHAPAASGVLVDAQQGDGRAEVLQGQRPLSPGQRGERRTGLDIRGVASCGQSLLAH